MRCAILASRAQCSSPPMRLEWRQKLAAASQSSNQTTAIGEPRRLNSVTLADTSRASDGLAMRTYGRRGIGPTDNIGEGDSEGAFEGVRRVGLPPSVDDVATSSMFPPDPWSSDGDNDPRVRAWWCQPVERLRLRHTHHRFARAWQNRFVD